ERHAGEYYAALKSATGRELTMTNGVKPEDDNGKHQRETGNAHGVTGGRNHAICSLIARREFFAVVLLFAQQQVGSHNRGEQDEFFAQRVKAAIIKVHRGYNVSGVALIYRERVQNCPIRHQIESETRQHVKYQNVKAKKSYTAENKKIFARA